MKKNNSWITSSYYSRLRNMFFFTNEEILFLLKNAKIDVAQNNSNKVLVQIQDNTEITGNFLKFINNKDHCVFGFFFSKEHYSLLEIFIPPIFLFKKIESFLLDQKRLKFFKKIGVMNFIFTKRCFFKYYKHLKEAYKIYSCLNLKKDVLKITYKEVLIGDLIYDTYLRMFKKSTLIIDLNLFFLIVRTIYEFNYLEKISENFKIYLTGYTTYTGNGLPVRVFLKKGLNVYSFSNHVKGKMLSKNDFYQTKEFWLYKNQFEKLSSKKEKITLGKNLINKRLEGRLDLKYMNYNPYKENNFKINENLDGVVFLHDFTDSNHVYRNMLFEDFYEWVVFTIDIIKKNDLKIGIKPHPNQNNSSKKIVKKLINEYPNISWINEKVSNKIIFSSGIKFGVSIYGTILSELAFKGIIPICCGDNPTVNYNFTFFARSKEEYSNYLINFKKLKVNKINKEEIGEFAYMHYLYEN